MCNNGTCIYNGWRCDGIIDCMSGEDEDKAMCGNCFSFYYSLKCQAVGYLY